MNGGTILGFALMIAVMGGIATAFVVFASALARLQVRIMEVQLASIRARGTLWIRIIAGIFILAGGMVALTGLGAPADLRLALIAPGLFIALLGLVMMVFAAPFARVQVRLLEWQIGWMSGAAGVFFIRAIGIILFVAFLGGLSFSVALGGKA
jgi:hypothetical protein